MIGTIERRHFFPEQGDALKTIQYGINGIKTDQPSAP